MKKLSDNQVIGERGEHLVAERSLAMSFVFTAQNRLETGIDGMLELRDPQTGATLAKWIGAQIKTTMSGAYSYEDDRHFEYLLNQDDLNYWNNSNIPVILVLVRLDRGDIYWKSVISGAGTEPRRLTFDKVDDKFDRSTADHVAALCIERDHHGSYVPPMLSGESVELTMLRVILPEKIYVAASIFNSGSEAAKELAKFDGHASFDWVIRGRRFISFRDPGGGFLKEIMDEGSVEEIDTDVLSLTADVDEEYAFIDLLRRTLSSQLDNHLSFDRDSRALFFRAHRPNQGRKYRYQSIVKETSAEVVAVWRNKHGSIGSVRHHAFVPRFQRIDDDWFLSITPTFVFTRDGFRPHYNASALVAGKKKFEKNPAIRGQFVMWRHLLIESGQTRPDLLAESGDEPHPSLRFERMEPIQVPLAVPESTWNREDPNAQNMIDPEWLI